MKVTICSSRQSCTKELERNQEIKQSQKIANNFDICFCKFLGTSTKNLFLQTMLFTKLCPHAVLGFSLFLKMLIFNSFGDSCSNLYIKFLVADIKFRFNCVKWKNFEIFIKIPTCYETD